MSERFIKLIDSDESDWLQKNHPSAFLLLCLIARRARRIAGHIDGLEIGEAHIGDYQSAGIQTRGQYRQALKILASLNFIKISETCRNRKKATTGTTTVGTKVKLLDSRIWDINPEINNHRVNHPTTTEQPRTRKNKKEKEEIEKIYKKENLLFDGKQVPIEVLAATGTEQHNIYYHGRSPENPDNIMYKSGPSSDNKQKSRKKYKRENFPPEEIIEFPPHVWMPKTEYDTLVKEIGLERVKYFITLINEYVSAERGSYDCYSYAIRNWNRRDLERNQGRIHKKLEVPFNNQQPGEPRFKASRVLEG